MAFCCPPRTCLVTRRSGVRRLDNHTVTSVLSFGTGIISRSCASDIVVISLLKGRVLKWHPIFRFQRVAFMHIIPKANFPSGSWWSIWPERLFLSIHVFIFGLSWAKFAELSETINFSRELLLEEGGNCLINTRHNQLHIKHLQSKLSDHTLRQPCLSFVFDFGTFRVISNRCVMLNGFLCSGAAGL